MVRIITDSAADFEPTELAQMNITCIPLPVSFGGTEYRDNVDLSKDRFYELLTSFADFPKTSQAAPQILKDLFLDAKQAGDEAIYITLSSALSGTYQTALLTKEMVDCDRCHVVDSKNGTGGQRIIVEYAVRLRDEGKTAAEIVAQLETFRDRIVLFACMDTLEYLYRGGRISHTVYQLGSLVHIKPILQVDVEGKVVVPAKAMGMRKGMDILCRQLQDPDGDHPLYVMYTSDRTVAETLAEKIRCLGYRVPDDRIIQVGAAIGSHIGPDACGLVYVR